LNKKIIQLFLVLKVNSSQFGHLFLQTRTSYTIVFYILKWNLIKMVSKNIIAIFAIVALVGTIGLSPAFADWDKTKYPNIEGTFQLKIIKIIQI